MKIWIDVVADDDADEEDDDLDDDGGGDFGDKGDNGVGDK